MYSEFLLFTWCCFLSVSSAGLAISKTDDVITENGFFFPPLRWLLHSSSRWSPWDCFPAIGIFFVFVFFSPQHRHCLRYPFITQMRRSRPPLATPGSDGPARRSVTGLLTGGWDSDCHLYFTCRPWRLPEDACKAIIVCALVDPVNNWLYWLSATAPQRDREGETRGSNYSHFNYMKVLIVVWAGQSDWWEYNIGLFSEGGVA